MGLNKKGVFFSTDALIALVIIFMTLLIVYPAIKYSQKYSESSGDMINVLSSLKIGEIDDPYVQSLIVSGEINNLNKSVLEQIAEFYAMDIDKAKMLASVAISYFDSEENLGIWYGSDLLASINKTPIETAKNIDVDRQIISGISKGNATTGFVAKAWLQKISKKQTSNFVKGDMICGGWKSYSWGYYCDSVSNNITYRIDIPQNATDINATWLAEGSWTNQPCKLYVNNVKVFDGIIGYYKIIDISSYISPGYNSAVLSSSTGGDDGASHVLVSYSTPDLRTFSQQKIFDFNIVNSKSVLHYEKSIFVPSSIFGINITINSSKDVTLSFRKGDQTFIIGKKSPAGNFVFFSNSEISNNLSLRGLQYSNLSNEYLFFIVDIGKDTPGQTVTLGANSYVHIDSADIPMPYGTIDITQGVPITKKTNLLQDTFYRNLVWAFSLPINSIPVFVDWQFGWLSTSQGTTSQKASANSISLYNSPPSDYIAAFSRFGYTPSRATGVFQQGANNFTLDFGNNYGVSSEASYGSLTYFVRSFVNYGDAKSKARGGTRTVLFEDGSSKQISVGDANDAWDPANDAIDDAVDRLLAQLDSNGDGKIDIVIDQSSLDIETIDVSGVPYLWSTEVQTRRWD